MSKSYYCPNRDRQGLFPYVCICTLLMQVGCRHKCSIPPWFKD